MDIHLTRLKQALTLLLTFLLAISAIILLIGFFDGHFENVDTLRLYLHGFGVMAPLMLILIQALQVVLPVLPGFLGCAVGAGMFGAAGGFWCNYIGISLGSLAAFFLARRYGRALVEKMMPMEKYHKVTGWIEKHQCFTLVLALAILLPLAPDDFLCYFSGLTRMRAGLFTWIIILAKPWCILGYCLVFAGLL